MRNCFAAPIVLVFITVMCGAEELKNFQNIFLPSWSTESPSSENIVTPIDSPQSSGSSPYGSPAQRNSNSQQAVHDQLRSAQTPTANLDAAAIAREHILREAAARRAEALSRQNTAGKVPQVPYSTFQALNREQPEPSGHDFSHLHNSQHPAGANFADRKMHEAFHNMELQKRLREMEAEYAREHRQHDSRDMSIWGSAFRSLFGFGQDREHENPSGWQGGSQSSEQSDAQALVFIPVLVGIVFAYFIFNCVKIAAQMRSEEVAREESDKNKRTGSQSNSNDIFNMNLGNLDASAAVGGLSSLLTPTLLASLAAKQQEGTAKPAPAPAPAPVEPPQAAATQESRASIGTKDVRNLSFDELIALQQALLEETIRRQQEQAASPASPASDSSGLRKRVTFDDKESVSK